MSDNVETMAWTGEVPWHGFGKEVSNDLTSEQMMEAAGVNWSVGLYPIEVRIKPKPPGKLHIPYEGKMALVRESDNAILDTVGEDWRPLQNADAFNFFNDYIKAGDMEMHTAGSLRNGKFVWALAKVKAGFTLFNGDTVESYLLFTNPHQYGSSIDVRFTPVRVVCNNTLTMALKVKAKNSIKSSHRVVFNPEKAKEELGLAQKKLEAYKDIASFLGSKRYSQETIKEFFDAVFPVVKNGEGEGKRKAKEVSKNAQLAMKALEFQPGQEFAPGSWWQGFNAVTYVTDHLAGRENEARLENIWYGQMRDRKIAAQKLAMEFAEKA